MQESETLRKDGGALSNKRPPRILVVDDDSRLRDLLRQFLTNNGFHVSVAENAEQMNRLWLRERFDAVVLDVMMPGEDGISILKRIRASNDTTPILMLTAKGEDIDRILGLELGADDYLPKPYNPRELLARLHAILRRREPVDPPGAPSKEDEVVRFGNFSLDLGTRKLSKGDDEAFDRSLDVQVSRLRKIIEPDPSKPRYLQTVWGLGYVFIPDGASDAQDKK